MTSYKDVPPAPSEPKTELSRSLDDAFQFTSSSISSPTLQTPTGFPSPDVSSSTRASEPVKQDVLITEHKKSPAQAREPILPEMRSPGSARLLEAFLEDDTPVTLNNIPMRHSTASLLKSKQKSPTQTPKSTPAETLILQENGQLLYHVLPNDTLEGLSLRFGVKSVDIKKANKLFNARDLCARKTCVIPLTPEQYQQYQNERNAHLRREEEQREEVVGLFMDQSGATRDVAFIYLEDSHFHLGRALERYHLENSTTTESLGETRSYAHLQPKKKSKDKKSAPNGETEVLLRQQMAKSHQETIDQLFDL